jgi:hypothetical protein
VARVLLIVASRHDPGAALLVSRWKPVGAILLTCEDLSSPGWCFIPPEAGRGTLVASGEVIPVRALQGVLSRRPCILPDELSWVTPEDRQFVAAEMTAFTLAWLATLPCPVVNRPTPMCLNGPRWRAEQWASAASRLGIPARHVRRRVGRFERPQGTQREAGPRQEVDMQVIEDPTELTVVGSRVLGSAGPRLRKQALRLARAAGASLLSVWFDGKEDGSAFCGASPWPDVGREDVAEALLELFGLRAAAKAAAAVP